MIGSHKGKGIMYDNDEEGWDKFTIDQVSDKATGSLKRMPNVILLLVGTNNMKNDDDAAAAPGRLEALLDKVITPCKSRGQHHTNRAKDIPSNARRSPPRRNNHTVRRPSPPSAQRRVQRQNQGARARPPFPWPKDLRSGHG
jgi:hypothetical protein